MARPRLLMLDEPSLGLAPRLVSQAFETIGVLRGEGITVLMVEPNVAQALQLAEQAYVLELGRIVLAGSGRELLNSPHVRRAYLGL
jgi:branched-chain amino acid transport system ATP-binding protein